MDTLRKMKLLMEPKSVALLGVSRNTGAESFNILENLLIDGYEGKIYPVNPNTSEILGVRTFPNVASIGKDVDQAIINLPRFLVPGVVRECAEAGIQSMIIVTQGFADAIDNEGKQLQKEIDEVVQKNGVRIVGPNSIGVANAFINFNSSFMRAEIEKIPIGTICQTGVFFIGFPQIKVVGKGIDLGNACDVDFADGLEYFELDTETNLVILHIEGSRDNKRLLNAANQTAQKKPVIALKTAKTASAAKAAQSHTGSLTGRTEIWESALRQSGVIQVSDIDELSDLVRAFSVLPPMKGRRIGVVSLTGAFGIMAIDACYKFNLELAELSPSSMAQISGMAPPWLRVGNPVDIWPMIMLSKQPVIEGLIEGIDTILSDRQVDAVLYIGAIWSRESCSEFYELFSKQAEAHPDKPFVCYLYGSHAAEVTDKLHESSRAMAFLTPERAIRTLAHLADYSTFRNRL